jgi:hypothetical protein
MGKPYNLPIRFEGLDRLRTLKDLHYHTRQCQSDDTEKISNPYNLPIRFEGLVRLRTLKGLHTV